MAPKPPASSRGSSKSVKGRKPGVSSAPRNAAKSKPAGKRPPPQQVKTKPGAHNPVKPKKKKRIYTDKELDLPALNMITPAGVQKPRGKKKGKVFVDDEQSMMTILAMVHAEKDGQIESKMIKARQMEGIREARRKEAEVRHEKKNEKLEETKKSFKKRKPTGDDRPMAINGQIRDAKTISASKSSKKKVSFA